MRNLIILAFLAMSLSASATLQLSISGASFQATDTIQLSSSQYVDVKVVSGGWIPSDHIKIYIQHASDLPVVLFDSVFNPFFNLLPYNSDSSKRIGFKMPSTFAAGEFKLSINLGLPVSGILAQQVLTDVKQSQSEKTIKQINYFSISGQQLSNPQGLFIQQIIYQDESIEVKQFYRCN